MHIYVYMYIFMQDKLRLSYLLGIKLPKVQNLWNAVWIYTGIQLFEYILKWINDIFN